MKATSISLLAIAAIGALSSCAPNSTPAAPPLSQAENPYGIPQANPYGVPNYTPEAGISNQAPHQTIPAINSPATIQVPPHSAPAFPSAAPGPTTSHKIVKGESLWGISRKYNVTVDELRQANNLSGDTILEGATLNIPTR